MLVGVVTITYDRSGSFFNILFSQQNSLTDCPWAIGLLVSLFNACKGDDDDKSANNLSCEQNCAGKYVKDVAACDQQTTDCLSGCAGPDDTSCIWDCEDLEMVCSNELTLCSAQCPCIEASASCILDCGESEDQACYTACASDYLECAGGQSPFQCIMMCESNKSSCTFDCEDTTTDMDAYITCRSACNSTHESCVELCID